MKSDVTCFLGTCLAGQSCIYLGSNLPYRHTLLYVNVVEHCGSQDIT